MASWPVAEHSEFLKVETQTTVATGGLSNPSMSTASYVTDVADHVSHVYNISRTRNSGNASNSAMTQQVYQLFPVNNASRPSAVRLPWPTIQSQPSAPVPTFGMDPLDIPELSRYINRAKEPAEASMSSTSSPETSTLRMPPISWCVPPAAIHDVGSLQHPYGAPFLQPFPPPVPPEYLLRRTARTSSHGRVISRDEIRDIVLMIFQDDGFIDTVHRAFMEACRSGAN